MSVRGEYRRLGADLLAVLRESGDAKQGPSAMALAPLLERAAEDLDGAAEDTLTLLPELAAASPPDIEERRRFDDAYERLEAVCRIILGR
jgi:hypothetical protein